MKTLLLVNLGAGSADERANELIEAVHASEGVKVLALEHGRDAIELAAAAGKEGFARVVAAGGDGTVHKVVQGLLAGGGGPALGIVPLGTGNDFARTLEIPMDPLEAFEHLMRAGERRIDLIRVDAKEGVVYGINMAAGGFSGQVNEAVSDETKDAWGPLAYVRSAADVLSEITGYEASLSYDDEPPITEEVLNVVVANGKSCGGGILVAPDADPSDGLLDVVMVRNTSGLNLAKVAAWLLAGDYQDCAEVSTLRVKRLSLSSKPKMAFNVDGDLVTREAVDFSVMPGALRVLA